MSTPMAALARKVFEEYSRAGGNPPDAHFDRNAAEQWMAHALEFAGVAELIEAAEQAHSFLCEKSPATATEYRLRAALSSIRGAA